MGIIFSVIGFFMILYMATCNRKGNEPGTGGTGILATVLGAMGIIIMVVILLGIGVFWVVLALAGMAAVFMSGDGADDSE